MLVQPGRPKENKRKKAADEAQRISHKLKKSGPICPRIQDKLEVNKEATRDCTSTGLVDQSLKCIVRESSL